MLSIATILSLVALGYVMDQDDNKKTLTHKVMDQRSWLENPNEVPSSDSYHHNRFLTKVSHDTLKRATDSYVEAQDNNYLYRDIPETTWNKRKLYKHHKLLQTEEDVASGRVPKTTSLTYNDASYDVIQKSNAAAYTNLQGLNDTMSPIESFNERLNRMPNPQFDTITDDNCNKDLIKQTKYVREWKKGHNNMVPYFGGKSTQNTDPYVNEQKIERFTGSAPLYDHKKETNLFFKPIQDRWMEGEVKVDLELSRYNTSRHKNNVLPFGQMRVNKGLGKHPLDNEPIHGFHESWRPTGRGLFQDVNKLRVNPRFTFQNDYQTGQGFYQSQSTAKDATGDVKARLLHRKGVWNNEFIDQKKENFSTTSANHLKDDNFRTREILITRSQQYDAPMQAGISVIQLKEDADRAQCRPVLGPAYENRESIPHTDVAKYTVNQTTEDNLYPRINPLNTEATRGSTAHFDDARKTVAQTTEDWLYPHINPINSEATRGSTAHFDRAKETINETTEDNLYERINAHDNQRGVTYYFDKAKERIAQLTQDNPYPRVFPAHEKMGSTWWFDTAKETVAETTEEHPDPRINPRSQQQDNTQHYGTFECGSLINGLKEDAIAVNRLPVPVGAQNTPSARDIGEFDVFQRQQFTTYDNTKKFEPTAPMNISKELIGKSTNIYANNCYPKDTEIMGNRTDPYNVQQHKINPFSQSLHAWNVPYNQKYPIIP